MRNPHPHAVRVLPGGKAGGRQPRQHQQEDQHAHLLQAMQILPYRDTDQHQADNLHAVPAQIEIRTERTGDSAQRHISQQRRRQRLREGPLALDGQLDEPEQKHNLPRVLRSFDGMRQEDGQQAKKEKDGAVQKPAHPPLDLSGSSYGRRSCALCVVWRRGLLSDGHRDFYSIEKLKFGPAFDGDGLEAIRNRWKALRLQLRKDFVRTESELPLLAYTTGTAARNAATVKASQCARNARVIS